MATVVKTNRYQANTLDYSQEGLKSHIQFLVTQDAAVGTDGAGTLISAVQAAIGLTAAGNPARGTNHPYFDGTSDKPLLKADVIHAKAIDATTAEVDVDYAVLNAVTQEPSDAGDEAACLLTVASSLQSYEAVVDAVGNPVEVPYVKDSSATPGTLTIASVAGQGTLPSPFTNAAKLHSAMPSMVLRFQRREQAQRDGSELVGLYNGALFDAGDFGSFPIGTLLMTRVENVTRDEGKSWIVTYEMTFQFTADQPASGVYNKSGVVTPAVGGVNQMSTWDVGLYFVLPNGYCTTTNGSVKTVNPGEIPSDCVPTIFAVYGQDEGAFAALHLMG